jgi:hypothetical protein
LKVEDFEAELAAADVAVAQAEAELERQRDRERGARLEVLGAARASCRGTQGRGASFARPTHDRRLE